MTDQHHNEVNSTAQQSVDGSGTIKAPYILFSHITVNEVDKEGSDFSKYEKRYKDRGELLDDKGQRQMDPTLCRQLKICEHLTPFLPKLGELLNNSANPGILILFYATGYFKCLNGIADRMDLSQIRQIPEVRYAEEVGLCAQHLINEQENLKDRVRFITPLDLYEIFGHNESDQIRNLTAWFFGIEEEDPKLKYDAAKVIEAIIRVRMIGTGIPVFRIDHDVLFRPPMLPHDSGNAHEPKLGLQSQIADSVSAHRKRRDDPRISTYIFSNSYNDVKLVVPGKCKDFGIWSRAFATRVFPALCVKPGVLMNTPPEKIDWGKFTSDAMSEHLACKFFGLDKKRKAKKLMIEPNTGIGKLGAHPLVSVISGALLCISDGAILDLPPFSNFNRNVMWIDDHLKYSLHRELRHFTSVLVFTSPQEPQELHDSKIDSHQVVKGRPPVTNVPQYVLGDYLPTLLYGIIMDAWITPDTLIKWRPENLDEEYRQLWQNIPKSGPSEGLLPKTLQKVLQRRRNLAPIERVEFRRKLQAAALKRITEVRKEWSTLIDEGIPSFAWIWVDGNVSKWVEGMKERATGLVRPGVMQGVDLTLRDLNEYIREDLNLLIDDTMAYIEMTLNWPDTVHQIRSFEQGTLKTDLSWSE